MKFLTRIFKRVSLALAVAAGVTIVSTSCVKEDLEDCPPYTSMDYNLLLHITTILDAGTEPDLVTYDQFNINSVAVYIFDAEGNFVDIAYGGPYTPGQDYIVPLWLEPGDYRFAVVTNPGDMNRIEYTYEELFELRPDIDQIQMSVGTDVDPLDEDLLDLHLGDSGIVTIPEDITEPMDVTVVVWPKTYKVNFRAIGLPADHEYEFRVTDQNFLRSVGGEITSLEDMINYLRKGECTLTDPRTYFDTSMTLYDLSHEKTMPFEIYDATTGEVVFSGDLIDIIENAYREGLKEVDFHLTYEFDIEINFLAGMYIEITVNGWTYRVQNTNL